MEDINLSTTNHPNSTVKNHRGFILQDFLAKTFSSNVETPTSVNSGLNHVPFDQVLDSVKPSSGLMDHSIGGKRSLSVTDHRTDGDRRHKRMIKNRESAARSRARKQAYTNELENEVERLKQENAKLKRQHQLQLATTTQVTKKKCLQRTSTAPF